MWYPHVQISAPRETNRAITMKTTPTRRRRRADDAKMERWGDGEELQVPLMTLPLGMAHQPAQSDTASASSGSVGDPTPRASELQSLQDMLHAAQLLQRLDMLQSAAKFHGSSPDIDQLAADAHEYRSVCAELIEKHPWLSLSKGIDDLLWSSWQQELAALETAIAASGVRGRDSGEKQLRDALYVALSNYSALIQRVKCAASDRGDTRALLVHRLSLANAHVLYALEIHSASPTKNWRTAEEYYETARCWDVAQGETHYHLARIVLHDGRCAEALYHLVRSRIAEQPHSSPGSLAAQFAHVASQRQSSSAGSGAHEDLDRVMLATVAPFFGQQQEFLAQRRAPKELALAFCRLVDSVVDSEASDATVHSLQLVRLVCLLVACACLDSRFFEREGTDSDEVDAVAVKHPRAVELLVTCVNGLLHRTLMAITSPLESTAHKERALEVTLPSVNVAFAWLHSVAWRELVGEAARAHCERLSAMVLTAIISGGFLAPLEDQPAAGSVVLREDVERCGFPCLPHAAPATAALGDGLGGSDRDVLQRRIAQFLSSVEHFVAPRLSIMGGSTDAVAAAPPPVVAPMAEPLPLRTGSERVVVLDAANVAMRHGLQRRFSCRGIQLCAEYFLAQRDRVVAFLPDYCLDLSKSSARRRERWALSQEDRAVLEIMVGSGVVVLTPAMDSDDLYCIEYARRHGAFLVTNDLFRDHVGDADGRAWLAGQRISYTWVGDEFLPNPDSDYEKQRAAAAAVVAATNATE